MGSKARLMANTTQLKVSLKLQYKRQCQLNTDFKDNGLRTELWFDHWVTREGPRAYTSRQTLVNKRKTKQCLMLDDTVALIKRMYVMLFSFSVQAHYPSCQISSGPCCVRLLSAVGRYSARMIIFGPTQSKSVNRQRTWTEQGTGKRNWNKVSCLHHLTLAAASLFGHCNLPNIVVLNPTESTRQPQTRVLVLIS